MYPIYHNVLAYTSNIWYCTGETVCSGGIACREYVYWTHCYISLCADSTVKHSVSLWHLRWLHFQGHVPLQEPASSAQYVDDVGDGIREWCWKTNPPERPLDGGGKPWMYKAPFPLRRWSPCPSCMPLLTPRWWRSCSVWQYNLTHIVLGIPLTGVSFRHTP